MREKKGYDCCPPSAGEGHPLEHHSRAMDQEEGKREVFSIEWSSKQGGNLSNTSACLIREKDEYPRSRYQKKRRGTDVMGCSVIGKDRISTKASR